MMPNGGGKKKKRGRGEEGGQIHFKGRKRIVGSRNVCRMCITSRAKKGFLTGVLCHCQTSPFGNVPTRPTLVSLGGHGLGGDNTVVVSAGVDI